MMRYLLCTFSIFIGTMAFGQDSTKVSIKGGLQVYVDYGKLLTQPVDFESKLEFGLAYQLRSRFQPNFQYGIATITPEDAIVNGSYEVSGSYWRAGLNYLLPLDNSSFLYAGLKYAQSQFEDAGNYQIESDLWPTYTGSFQRSDLSATWYEIILGSERLLRNGHILLGGQTGIRLLADRSEEAFIDIYSIPGYGYSSDKASPFVNLYIKYQF